MSLGPTRRMARRMTLVGDIKQYLFPSSPIEVLCEGNEWHIFTEGEWNHKVLSEVELRISVAELIVANANDWLHPILHTNKAWVGWAKISRFQLLLLNESRDEILKGSFDELDS